MVAESDKRTVPRGQRGNTCDDCSDFTCRSGCNGIESCDDFLWCNGSVFQVLCIAGELGYQVVQRLRQVGPSQWFGGNLNFVGATVGGLVRIFPRGDDARRLTFPASVVCLDSF